MSAPPGRYLPANGVDTYYEVHGPGQGPPLLLLHGGLDTIEPFRAVLLPALARAHRVVLPERRGHGRTADLPGPITYDLMTADTIAFIEALPLPRCDIVGWSDGAIIALLIAIRRPELVGRLVLLSANYEPEGLRPDLRAAIAGWTAETFSHRMAAAYRALSPDGPAHLPIVLEKMKRLFLEEPRLTPADLARIAAPTLVIAGDDDVVEPEHTLRLFRALPNARLAIVPGGSHELPLDQPEAVMAVILAFLHG